MPTPDPPLKSGDTIIAIPRSSGLRPISLDLSPESVGGPTLESQFKVRLANTEGRRNRASYLITRRYAWRGYAVSNISADPANRITLAAFSNEHPIATISVGVDSPSGLAVEELYPSEVQALRGASGRLCEFTKLAVDNMIQSRAVLAAIFHIAYIYAHRIRACTDLLIEVNPRHVRFYRSMLGFETYGQERIDPRVAAPAVLMRLLLSHAAEQIEKYGGHAELSNETRVLYPLFFSRKEEQGIETRLRALE